VSAAHRYGRPVLLGLAALGTLVLVALVLVALVAAGTVWATGRLAGGFGDMLRSTERELRS
jgi:hypothetical protein